MTPQSCDARSIRRRFAESPLGRRIKAVLNNARAWRAGRGRTGKGGFIDASCHFIGRADVVIGDNVVIAEDGWFNVNHRGRGDAIRIGDNSFVGRRAFFSAGREIAVGSYALIGPDCRLMGAGHVVHDPFQPYVATGTTRDASIRIGPNCWLGAGVSLLGETHIGHGSVIGASTTLVNAVVAPFSTVVGSPGRVIKRYSILRATWVKVADFTAEDEAALPDEATYLAALRERAPRPHLPIVAAARSQGHLP